MKLYYLPRTAIEAEILFAARVMHLRFLERLSGKTPRKQSSSGKKIEVKSAVLHFVFFIVMVNKMQQSAKESCLLKRNTVPEVFPLTAGIAGSGKTRPFEKRHAGCEEREKINRRRIYDTLRINFFEATKQTACIFSKGDKNNPQGLRVHKHIFVGNSRLVTAMTHTDNNGDNAEQREKRYYYHSDHLGSAQFVTDWRGRQYEHIEYTPYGELWIEEVAAGLDKLPFRFTGKEMDEETGLYYYGARYLDPKYSRWLSGDPALGEYVPAAGADTSKLAGMGGVYNTVNLHLYHYAGNNPVKYMDPDGRHNDVAELAKLLPEMWAAAIAEPSVVGEIVVGAISLYILYRYNSSNADYDSNTLNAPSTIDRTFPNIQEQDKNVGSLPTKKDNTKPNSSSDEDIGSDMLEKYIPAPKDIPGIPGAERVKEKTPVKNGGGLRKRWKDNDGNIYEWDSQHGELEKYDKHGKHLGSVDPNTGEQIKPPKKGRKVEP